MTTRISIKLRLPGKSIFFFVISQGKLRQMDQGLCKVQVLDKMPQFFKCEYSAEKENVDLYRCTFALPVTI